MIFTAIGLILDIIGVLLLAIFGTPNGLAYEDDSVVIIASDPDPKKVKQQKYGGYAGLVAIIAGFGLQLIGLFYKA